MNSLPSFSVRPLVHAPWPKKAQRPNRRVDLVGSNWMRKSWRDFPCPVLWSLRSSHPRSHWHGSATHLSRAIDPRRSSSMRCRVLLRSLACKPARRRSSASLQPTKASCSLSVCPYLRIQQVPTSSSSKGTRATLWRFGTCTKMSWTNLQPTWQKLPHGSRCPRPTARNAKGSITKSG
jgi:hypothetical protein